MKCIICEGKKVISITVTSNLRGKPIKSEKIEIMCVHCRGSGSMTQDDIDHHNWSKEQWCKCDEYHGATYVDDNVSSICSKHHWTCNQCNKITQVG